MLFIVEGVDRTGKTTLCESQPTHTKSRYMHFSAPTKHPLDEYIRPLVDYIPGSGEDIWVDRHYLGELVWPTFFGRKTEFDAPMARYVEMFLDSRGSVNIYADVSTDLLEATSEGEPTAGREREASKLFEKAVRESTLWWHTYCYECNADPTQFAHDGYREERIARRPFKVTDRWVGSPEPDILLVGEQVGPASRGWRLPFVPYRSASGHFLMQEIGPYANRYGFALINAFKPGVDGEEDVAGFMRTLTGRPPKVVALGKSAHNVLKGQGVSHEHIYHPQYWRRFRRRNGRGSYGKLIMEAAK